MVELLQLAIDAHGGLKRWHQLKRAKGAHYVYDYADFGGIRVQTRRRVYAPAPDGKPLLEPLIVSVDVSDVRFT
jgi:hypothetical protein